MIAATAPETRVRIHNVNTGKLIEAIVQTPDGTVTYEGTTAIDGVPGTAAPIRLSLPRRRRRQDRPPAADRQVRDRIAGVEATCIDMAMPMVLLRAADFGKTGHERPAELDADTRLLRAAGGHPPRGRRADGARRRRGTRHPQAGPGLGRRRRRHAHRPLLHAARLPSRGRRHRCGRHRHGLRAAGQPRPGDGRAAAAGRRRRWSRSSTRPAASRSSSSWRRPAPRCRSCAPRSSAPPAGCSPARCSFPIHHRQPIRETHDVDAGALSSPRPAPAALVAARPASLPSAADAQAYPDRPIRLVVPYAAGGGTDAIARVIAQGMTEQLGQQLVVENNGTAGGNVATAQAAKADPDGYTLLMANQGPMTVNPHLFKNVKIDPLTAFDPVTLIAEAPLVVVVPEDRRSPASRRWSTQAKSNPGGLTYGSAGNGSASHLATLLLAHTAGLDMVHVPYKGAGPGDHRPDRRPARLHDHDPALGRRLHRQRQGEAAGGHHAGARQAAAGGADHRRERLPRLPGRGLVRLRGAEGHAAGDRGQAARGHRRRAPIPRRSSAASTSRVRW